MNFLIFKHYCHNPKLNLVVIIDDSMDDKIILILLIIYIEMSKKTEKPVKSPEKKVTEKEKKIGFPLCINNK